MGDPEHLSLAQTPSTVPADAHAHAQTQNDRGMAGHAEDRFAPVPATGALTRCAPSQPRMRRVKESGVEPGDGV